MVVSGNCVPQMRQLMNRVVPLMRGEPRTFERCWRWRVERYDVCEAADSRVYAPPEAAFDAKFVPDNTSVDPIDMM